MHFFGEPVRLVGNVSLNDINKLIKILSAKFEDKWVQRTFKLMEDCYCLKAITPSNLDILDVTTQEELKELLVPFIEPFMNENERIVYLDISSIPGNKRTLAHVDYALFQMVSRRIHIPIVTNDKVRFAVYCNKQVHNYHLELGKAYEVNNEIVHLAANLGSEPRWHIIADVIDKDIYDCLCKKDLQYYMSLSPSINDVLHPKLIEALNNAVEGDAIHV